MNNKKIALITGASNGIGLEIAKKFAANDYNIIIVARDVSKLNEAKLLLEKYKINVQAHSADLSNYDEIEELKKWIDSEGYIIDSLVLNAGQGLGGAFIDTSLQQELFLIRLNIDSYVHLSKLFIPAMVKRQSGKVLMTSSVSGTAPIPFECIYGATKAFENSFFYAVRNETRGTGVEMTLLLPGSTDTNFHINSGQANTIVGSKKKDSPADVAERAWYGLMSGAECVYGNDEHFYEVDVLNRMQSESQKAQRIRPFTEPNSADRLK
ncbi:short-chain dehydrogenase [Chryseobacterium shigense]|uniref:Short-chain dehydrogenase n=1 Tax=Chryseobacterium shigense TaxID=297244 RepID=A0A1N7I8A4_9FLAO|nr:SDR family NAD(P)-dependent oxidoreductase [Chryseobacterium shigense]PQA96979.1 short-chain dehydrogenase [Chryseobacterium shigense]SIS33326.1 Short-chain dehydrogenase [Chryseobacterium shigense]